MGSFLYADFASSYMKGGERLMIYLAIGAFFLVLGIGKLLGKD